MWRERVGTRSWVLIALVASLGLLSACSGSASPAKSTSLPATRHTPAAFPAVPQPAPLRWRACPSAVDTPGAECAALKVPLDYAKPTGAQITLELSRVRHTSSASNYLGAILVNPGGPGGSGLGLVGLGGAVPNGVGGRFDWIGWDPRGVGASRPVLQCNTDYFSGDRPSYTASQDASVWLKRARGYAQACGRDGGALLQHMTTEDNARDMDVIRQALRQPTISYYGYSWGSYLGQVYLTLFPGRVKRVVLDGVVDPRRVWYAANFDQDKAFEYNMRVFFGWIAQNDAVYRLGSSGAAVYAAYDRELKRLAASPAAGGQIGPDEFADAILSAGYATLTWPQNATAISRLINDGDAGEIAALYSSRVAGAANENNYAVYNAVQCTDMKWPGWSQTRKDAESVAKAAPFETWANTWYNAPCLTWPAAARTPVTITASPNLPKILLIAETHDAATPFTGALEVRRLFPGSSLIEGVGGTTHAGSLQGGVACTDDTVATYLATGRTPARRAGDRSDLRCPPVPRPPASMQ